MARISTSQQRAITLLAAIMLGSQAAAEGLMPDAELEQHAAMAANMALGPDARRGAVKQLAEFAGVDPRVGPALLAAATDPDHTVRLAGISGLAGLEPLTAEAESAIIAGLSDPNEWVRRVAVAACAKSLGRQAVGLLLQQLADESIPVQAAAADALGELGAEETTDALGGMLAAAEPRVRLAAARALVRLGDRERALDALALIIAADDQARIARDALRAIAEAGHEAASVLPVILDATDVEARYVRGAALEALAAVDPGTPEALQVAVRHVEDRPVAAQAARAVAALGGQSDEAFAALMRGLSGESGESVEVFALFLLEHTDRAREVTRGIETAMKAHPALERTVLNALRDRGAA